MVSRSPVIRGSRRCRARGSTRWHSRSLRNRRPRRHSWRPKSGTTKAVAQIVAAGGTTLIGTDNPIGYGNFGQVIAMSVMAQTGLGNYQALRAATVEPAKIMGVSNQLGTIQAGMIADMDVIHGNPLDDIQTIANDVYVMQNGNLYTPQQLIGPYRASSASSASAAKRGHSRAGSRRVPVWETPGELRKSGDDGSVTALLVMGRLAGARAAVARCVGRSSAGLALAVALVVVSGGVAHADGDPASDYLVANQVFVSSQATGMSPAQRQLVAAVAAANRAGFAIRVAVVANDYDLGSVTELWHQPRAYARFLDVELSSRTGGSGCWSSCRMGWGSAGRVTPPHPPIDCS